MPTFPMFRARLTNDLFRKIMEDVQIFTFQYRPLAKHNMEEARSRFLSAVNTHISSEDSISGLVLQSNRSPILWLVVQHPRIYPRR